MLVNSAAEVRAGSLNRIEGLCAPHALTISTTTMPATITCGRRPFTVLGIRHALDRACVAHLYTS